MNNATNLRSLVALGILAATISAAWPGSASAQQRRGGAFGGFADNPGMALWAALDQGLEDVSERLALSDEQVSRTAALVADFREANKSYLARWDRVRDQMRNRMGGGARRGGAGGARRGGGGGDPQARQAMQEMRSLVEQLGPAFETLHWDFTQLLNEDQTQTLRQVLRRPPRG